MGKCWNPDCRDVAVSCDGSGWKWCAAHIDQEHVGGPLQSEAERLDVDYYRNKARRIIHEAEARAYREAVELCKQMKVDTSLDTSSERSAGFTSGKLDALEILSVLFRLRAESVESENQTKE